MGRRSKSRGFSIIELLIVVGILAVLISIMLPTVARARELSRRTGCAANLKSLGVAARAFATDNGGKFPITYGIPAPKETDLKRMPLLVSLDSSLMSEETKWKRLGIPMSEWSKYGAPMATWKCASSQFEQKSYNTPDGTSTGDEPWGPMTWTDYMYLGGLQDKSAVLQKSKGWWGILMPAVSIHDPRPDERLLAADAAFYAGNGKWGRQFHINHPSSTSAQSVGYQGVLYADGHVEENAPAMFPKALHVDTTKHYSLLHDNKDGAKGYFFWGAAVAYTPGKEIPPPPPPAPPAPPPTPGSPTPPTPTPPPTPPTPTPPPTPPTPAPPPPPPPPVTTTGLP